MDTALERLRSAGPGWHPRWSEAVGQSAGGSVSLRNICSQPA